MLRNIILCLGLFTLVACGSGPVKVVDPLTPQEAPNQVRLSAVSVTYSELAAEKISEDDRERAEGAAEGEETELNKLPLTEVLSKAVRDEIAERGITGDTPVNIAISVDTMKYQNGMATILFGSSDQLSGSVKVSNAETNEVIADFYVDLIKGNGGLLGLAIRGWGIRERFAETFAEHVADQLYGEE